MILYSVRCEYGMEGMPEVQTKKRLFVRAHDEREAAEIVIAYLQRKGACEIRLEEPYVLPVINDTMAELNE